ncbi:RUS1 family protein C16orf58 homolog isoform X2 [Belonocnema kinseyi]|nr:RUS1 family protein C16orf58 homolog isoform X2 [Belonocnema kinseyi]XP_033230707.1 RUS1 family protein C16orf58 homolog isoform X2 [Belonocnema kinseyi]XP_033230708.1 RUS1 family protein C16orf58 homolog isoform X2 [Belonocnema kinseyi]
MGTLTTHSIMQGVGVGESTATPLAAAITWILKDGTGMIGRIVFTWWKGSVLDAQCKQWRLFADVINDIAMGIELVVPYFSQYSMIVLCASTGLKSIVGVAGGATRAAITQHQALQGNMADVSAKDGSQETLVNLVASMLGIWIISHLREEFFILLYAFLVFVHLFANYSAVRALRFHSINENRLSLIMMIYDEEKRIPTPDEVNKLEPVFFTQNLVKAKYGFRIKMGCSFQNVSQVIVPNEGYIRYLSNFIRREKFFACMDVGRNTNWVFLKKEANSTDAIRAYLYSYCIGRYFYEWFPEYKNKSIFSLKKDNLDVNCFGESLLIKYLESEDEVFRNCEDFISQLKETEWTIDSHFLPIGPWRGSWEDDKSV